MLSPFLDLSRRRDDLLYCLSVFPFSRYILFAKRRKSFSIILAYTISDEAGVFQAPPNTMGKYV